MARRRRCPGIFVLMRIVFGTAFFVALVTAIKWHVMYPLCWWTVGLYAAAVIFGIAAQKLRC